MTELPAKAMSFSILSWLENKLWKIGKLAGVGQLWSYIDVESRAKAYWKTIVADNLGPTKKMKNEVECHLLNQRGRSEANILNFIKARVLPPS